MVVFLQKTKCLDELMKVIEIKVWKRSVVVELDSMGAIGGIEILWITKLIRLFSFVALQRFIYLETRIVG